MPRKKGVLILALICLFLPTFSYAQEEGTQVGIGFSTAETPKQPSPSDRMTPMTNVLPSTATTRTADALSPTSKGTLPQTGEAQSVRLRVVGLLCLVVCYWLFLFLNMNEEEESYDEEN